MRIILGSHSATLDGGSERSLLEIAGYLASRPSTEVLAVVPGEGVLSRALEQRGISWRSLPYDWAVTDREEGIRASISSIAGIRRLVAEFSPDVIMTNTAVIPWFGYAALQEGIPHAWFLREFVGSKIRSGFYPDPEATLATIHKLSDRVFVNSHFMRSKYVTALGREDVQVVYPTIGREILDHVGRGGPLRDGAAFRLIVYGMITPHKNQLEVLKASRLLRKNRDDFVVTIMGRTASHEYHASLVDFVQTHQMQGFVRFLEHQDSPYEVVREQDICIVPSMCEPFGRVTVEAMVLGKAVVASDLGGNREIVENSGGAGMLYPPGRPDLLAERLRWLMEEPGRIRQMGDAAQRHATRRFIEEDSLSVLYEGLKSLSSISKLPQHNWITDLAIAETQRLSQSIESLRLELEEAQREKAPSGAPLDVLEVTRLPADRAQFWGYRIDSPKPGSRSSGAALEITGWILGRTSAVVAVEIVHGETVVHRAKVEALRRDLVAAFPGASGAEHAGFRARVSMMGAPASFTLQVRAELEDRAEPVPIGRIRLARANSPAEPTPLPPPPELLALRRQLEALSAGQGALQRQVAELEARDRELGERQEALAAATAELREAMRRQASRLEALHAMAGNVGTADAELLTPQEVS